MNMVKYERLKSWAQEADKQKRSGMTQSEWCKVHGISIHTLKYRLKVLKREEGQLMGTEGIKEQVQFAEVPGPVRQLRAFSEKLI